LVVSSKGLEEMRWSLLLSSFRGAEEERGWTLVVSSRGVEEERGWNLPTDLYLLSLVGPGVKGVDRLRVRVRGREEEEVEEKERILCSCFSSMTGVRTGTILGITRTEGATRPLDTWWKGMLVWFLL